MPGFDKTGPNGQGPMSGRRRGRCRDTKPEETTDNNAVNNNEIVYGLGRRGKPRGGGFGKGFGGGSGNGMGRGRGRGFGNR